MRACAYTICLMLIVLASSAFANKQIEVNPTHVVDRNYKISIAMPCDWNGNDLTKTDIYGYYDNGTAELFQTDLTLPTKTAFGMDFLLEFAPDIMVLNGMPIKRIVIDYVEIPGKHCPSGFGGGMLTK